MVKRKVIKLLCTINISYLLRSLASFLARLSSIIRGLLSLQASEAVELISMKPLSTTYLIFWTSNQVFDCSIFILLLNSLLDGQLAKPKVYRYCKIHVTCYKKQVIVTNFANKHVCKVLKIYIQHVWPINRVCWVKGGAEKVAVQNTKSCSTKHQRSKKGLL